MVFYFLGGAVGQHRGVPAKYFLLFVLVFTVIFTPLAASEDPAFEEAVAAAKKGRFRQARELIEKHHVSGNPPEFSYQYIAVLSRAGQVIETIKEYESLPAGSNPPLYAVDAAARCYARRCHFDKALSAYRNYFQKNPDDRTAGENLFYRHLERGEFNAAARYAREAAPMTAGKPSQQPASAHTPLQPALPDNTQQGIQDKGNRGDSIEELLGRARTLEDRHEYLESYLAYSDAFQRSPENSTALNSKYLSLLCLGCHSLAAEQMLPYEDRLLPEIRARLMGDEAMVRIRWEEPEAALAILERNMSAIPVQFNEKLQAELLLRARYDRILAMARKWRMAEVIKEYEIIKKSAVNNELPAWVAVNAADAYSYFENADEALRIYRELEFDPSDPNYFETKMMVFTMLVELGDYREAGALLEEIDEETPVEIVERGILQENWRKEEIAVNRAWWYLYQDRLVEAEKYLQYLLKRAPANTHTRTVMAHLYLWKGWGRRALKEFEISRTLVPASSTNNIGYCYALWENGREKEAGVVAGDLVRQYPGNKHVQSLDRFLQAQNRGALSVSGGSVRETPGAGEMKWSARFEQRAGTRVRAFGEVFRLDVAQNVLNDSIRRAVVGINWRAASEWWLEGSVSGGMNGENPGAVGAVTIKPGDHFTLSARYDSYSIFVPLQARAAGITADEWNGDIVYRRSEGFQVEGRVVHFSMSDNNLQRSYSLKADKQLTADASWKTRLGLEGHQATSRRSDVPYFSPERVASFYMVPSVEHNWYRKYRRPLPGRLSLGIGRQWQAGFGARAVWFARYEQEYKPAENLSITLGSGYALQNYDGEDTGVWSLSWSVNNRF